jgi:hypothetical protein
LQSTCFSPSLRRNQGILAGAPRLDCIPQLVLLPLPSQLSCPRNKHTFQQPPLGYIYLTHAAPINSPYRKGQWPNWEGLRGPKIPMGMGPPSRGRSPVRLPSPPTAQANFHTNPPASTEVKSSRGFS